MSKLSCKTLFIIFFFLLIGVVVLSKFVLPNQKVSAAWWNDMWNYRKAISIGNTSGSNLNNQRVKIIIDTAALVTAGKLQSDCDDIRITDINGNLLDHWDTGCNTSTTNIYFKTSSLLTSGSTIYFYYGNSSANNIEKVLGTNENPGTSCKMMKDQGSVTTSGLYYVAPGGNDTDKIQVYCNTNIISDAWTLVMNNGAYTIPPKPTWANAINTVNITGTISNNLDSFDLLLGLKHWNYLGNTALIQMGSDPNTITKRAHYSSFSLITSNNYALALGGQTIDLGGTAPGFYSSHNGQQFTTYDADHDTYVTNCSTLYSNTPWWYHSCWSGNFWGGGDGGGYQNKPFWLGASTDYYNYGGIYIGGTDSMKNITVSSPSSEETSTAPIAYWKFDEGIGTTAYDSTSNQNNGTISGATWQTEDQCISGKCLSFPGTSSNISVPDNNLLKPSQITISGWVKINQSKNQYIINKGDGSGTGAGYNVYIYSNNKLAFWFYNGAGNLVLIDTGANSIQLNNWYFFEATYDGTNSKIYLNSVLKNTSSNTSGFTQKVTSLNINNNSLSGYLDDIKIYPYARTAAQIKLDYNSRGSSKGSSANLGVKSNTAPDLNSKLVAYYKFDEGQGTIVNNWGNGGSSLLGNLSNTTWTNDGKFNKALNFNGSNSVVSIGASIPISNEATFTGWFKINSFNDWASIFGNFRYANNTNSIGFNFIPFSGFIRVCNGNGTGAYVTNNFNSTDIVLNKWIYGALVYDGTNIKVYINGKFLGSAARSLSHTNTNFVIGRWATDYSSNYYFPGTIDEVKIYNSALSADEIKMDYNQGSAIQMGSSNQTIGATTTSLEYCIPGDTTYCASPVAEWNFEENTGTSAKDTSGNNNTGTFGTGNSAPTWSIGKKGAGLNFSGKQYATVTDNATLKPTTAITAEAWFNTSNISAPIQKIISKTESSGYLLGVNENSVCPVNTVCFLIDINNTYYSASYASSNLSNNTWYHLAGLYDGSTVKLFLNGSNVGTTATISNTIIQGAYNLCIGSESNAGNCSNGGGFFLGKIDNVRIYNYARTPAQIAWDYNKGGPVGWWQLDECQGNIAQDWSGVGNTGTIIIGASGTQNSLGTCQVGTSAAWTNGAIGKINASLNFDGYDDYIDITDNTTLTSTDAITISSWVKPIAIDGTRMIVTSSNYAYRVVDGKFETLMTLSGSNYYSTSSNNVDTDTWSHLVTTYNKNNGGNVIHLYINGKEVSYSRQNNTSGGSLPSGTSSILIGKRTDGYLFQGQIDDVRIYNYALTSEQVKILYNGGSVSFN